MSRGILKQFHLEGGIMSSRPKRWQETSLYGVFKVITIKLGILECKPFYGSDMTSLLFFPFTPTSFPLISPH